MENKTYFFTKEEFQNLYDAEIHFLSIRHSNCLKNCPRWLIDHVANVWEAHTNQKVKRNWNCSTCVFNFLALVGKYYLQDKEIYLMEQQVPYEQEQEDEPIRGNEEPVEVFTESPTFNIVEQPENNEQPKPKEPKKEIVIRKGRKPKK